MFMMNGIFNMWHDIVMALSQSKDAFQAVFAVTGLFVAVLGLRAWRRQLAGRTEYELARQLLRAVFRVRDQVNSLRSPFISGGEMYSAAKAKYNDEGELARALDKHDQLAELAYQVRWDRVQKAMSELAVQEIEAEVLWADRFKPIFSELYDSLGDLRNALEDYLSMRRGDYGDVPKEEREATRSIVLRRWGTRSNKKDVFGEKFGKAVQSLSTAVRPYLDIK